MIDSYSVCGSAVRCAERLRLSGDGHSPSRVRGCASNTKIRKQQLPLPVRQSLTAHQAAKPRVSADELITSAMNGKNETRLLGIRFQLLSEVNDVRIDGARVRIIFVTPYRIQQSI